MAQGCSGVHVEASGGRDRWVAGPSSRAGRSIVASDTDSAKRRAAAAGARLVESGMTVGLGSGSTAALMVRQLAVRIEREHLRITGVPTSRATAELARGLRIPLRELDEVEVLDLDLDGADE